MRWHWDQGHSPYLRFDTIKRIAAGLCSLENIDLSVKGDPLRSRMEQVVQLDFAAPETHKVWRQYKRAFGCALLASEIDGRMICTELCHQIAAPSPDDLSADAYFAHFFRKFYFPTPALTKINYTSRGPQHFPVCAILKLLLARLRRGLPPVVTIDEIIHLIIANDCTGDEPVEHYAKLMPKQYSPSEPECRQIREFVIFLSQASILKWEKPCLYLDVDASNLDAIRYVEALARPEKRVRKPVAALELLELGKTGNLPVTPLLPSPVGEVDLAFSEGKPKRVTHLRYERSAKLRDLFFASKRAPFLCDMCSMNVTQCYPWTTNLLEVHHLLPLASPLQCEDRRTSISQLVGICPNCHKATHLYYKIWLDDHRQDDFASYDQAREIYNLAKKKIVIHN